MGTLGIDAWLLCCCGCCGCGCGCCCCCVLCGCLLCGCPMLTGAIILKKIVFEELTFAKKCFVNFCRYNVCFCSHSVMFSLFFGKAVTSQNGLLTFFFFWKRHIPEKTWKSSWISSKKLKQQRQTSENVEESACEASNLVSLRRCHIFSFSLLSFVFFIFSCFFVSSFWKNKTGTIH